jgi:hypothetical protein
MKLGFEVNGLQFILREFGPPVAAVILKSSQDGDWMGSSGGE